jgi:D-proline dehydrogenase
MSFVVVGGGIYGLFIAYHLINEGADVTIIDQTEPGSWSRAAVGLLEYKALGINIINTFSYLMQFINMIRKNDATIKYIDKNWIFKYFSKLGRKIPENIINAIKIMNDHSRETYRRLAEEKNDFEYSEEPYYELTNNVENVIKKAKKDPLNPKFEVSELMGRYAIIFKDTAKLSTDLLINRLLRELERSKTRFIKAFVWDINEDSVYLNNGRIVKSDTIIVAAGYYSSILGIPIMPFKGFGIRIKSTTKFNYIVSFDDLGIFILPFNNWLKISSRFDPDSSIDTKPLREIIKRIKRVISDFEIIDITIGYRPCAPDGLPIIDKINDKIFVATGGCRLGWTQAPGAAKLIVDLALGKIKQTSFNIKRFSNEFK